LHPQVDYGLVAELAKRRRGWNFVLVGNVVPVSDTRAEFELAECRSLPNVFFLGAKAASAVPSYLTHMDVNLMFYRIADGNWIKAIYPLKLHEYLATGHPVVSADVPSVRPFSHVVKIANGVDEWDAAIEEALTCGGRGTPEQRRAVAAENGWNQRVTNLDSWLTELAAFTSV
jgi:glycosyltransferase involved in cell wall biosynthesis